MSASDEQDGPRTHRVLVVTDTADPSPSVTEAVRRRAETHDARFHLVVLNPARAEVHLLHPERRDKVVEAEAVLRAALARLEVIAGAPVIGSVSVRHDPMDVIEEAIFTESVDEILVDVPVHRVSSFFHQDLVRRLAHHHIPVRSLRQERPTR